METISPLLLQGTYERSTKWMVSCLKLFRHREHFRKFCLWPPSLGRQAKKKYQAADELWVPRQEKDKSTNIIKFSVTWPRECFCFKKLCLLKEDKAAEPVIIKTHSRCRGPQVNGSMKIEFLLLRITLRVGQVWVREEQALRLRQEIKGKVSPCLEVRLLLQSGPFA